MLLLSLILKECVHTKEKKIFVHKKKLQDNDKDIICVVSKDLFKKLLKKVFDYHEEDQKKTV